jgi:hypothetical protein
MKLKTLADVRDLLEICVSPLPPAPSALIATNAIG